MPHHYHYIITGAGCAGSSLLMRMMREPFFADKKILIIDQSPKTTNDRTWCFWEKQPGIFESIVYHQWEKLNFFSEKYSSTLEIEPYQYKMIRGIDFYSFVKSESAKHSNIEWRYENVKRIETDQGKAIVQLETEKLTADYVFNSILFRDLTTPPSGGRGVLLQHFKGWVIETQQPCFDPSQATFMDFRVSQEHGTTFVYLLPTSTTTALVEYTLFTETVLPKEAYDNALKEYISSFLRIPDYKITHEEFGVLPMTNEKFPLQDGRVVNMGIAGGQMKGSSGYAFQFILKRTEQVIRSIVKTAEPFINRSFTDRKFHLYDRVLLNVLQNKKMKGDDVFARIFQKNPTERVLQFLDNESSLQDDWKIMRSVPGSVFLPAALKELFT
ncbi:MAG: lycopene cyclase family protein [Bacteroidota bacterium]